jgi:hypothetical protein
MNSFYKQRAKHQSDEIKVGAERTVLLIVTLILVHLWLPAGRRKFKEIAPGILVTLVLWLAAGILFGRYLADYAFTYSIYYAGPASVMIALVFLYLQRLHLHLRWRAQRHRHQGAREGRRGGRAGGYVGWVEPQAKPIALSPRGYDGFRVPLNPSYGYRPSHAALCVSSLILRAWSTASRAALLWVNNSRFSASSSVTGVIARSV